MGSIDLFLNYCNAGRREASFGRKAKPPSFIVCNGAIRFSWESRGYFLVFRFSPTGPTVCPMTGLDTFLE